jgi:hypothetical protein
MEDGRWKNNFEMNFLDLLSVIFAKIFASFAVKKQIQKTLIHLLVPYQSKRESRIL